MPNILTRTEADRLGVTDDLPKSLKELGLPRTPRMKAIGVKVLDDLLRKTSPQLFGALATRTVARKKIEEYLEARGLRLDTRTTGELKLDLDLKIRADDPWEQERNRVPVRDIKKQRQTVTLGLQEADSKSLTGTLSESFDLLIRTEDWWQLSRNERRARTRLSNALRLSRLITVVEVIEAEEPTILRARNVGLDSLHLLRKLLATVGLTTQMQLTHELKVQLGLPLHGGEPRETT